MDCGCPVNCSRLCGRKMVRPEIGRADCGVRAEGRPFPVRPAEAPRNAAATVAPWDEKYPTPRRCLGSVCLGLPGEQSAPAAPAAPGYFALATTSPRWILPQGSTQWMLHVGSCRTA